MNQWADSVQGIEHCKQRHFSILIDTPPPLSQKCNTFSSPEGFIVVHDTFDDWSHRNPVYQLISHWWQRWIKVNLQTKCWGDGTNNIVGLEGKNANNKRCSSRVRFLIASLLVDPNLYFTEHGLALSYKRIKMWCMQTAFDACKKSWVVAKWQAVAM